MRKNGFSLIEVLIALGLLSFSLLALLRSQQVAFFTAQAAYLHSVEINQIANLSESLHACAGNADCQIGAIKDWEKELSIVFPRNQIKMVWHGSTVVITMNLPLFVGNHEECVKTNETIFL